MKGFLVRGNSFLLIWAASLAAHFFSPEFDISESIRALQPGFPQVIIFAYRQEPANTGSDMETLACGIWLNFPISGKGLRFQPDRSGEATPGNENVRWP